MAHYAFLDNNNIVTEVIIGRNEFEKDIDWEEYYGNLKSQICKRTSFNTYAGKHKNGEIPFRKNYAGIGYFYDEQRDAFIPPKLFESWVLNEETCTWDPPVPMPDDGNPYGWNEETQSWDKLEYIN